MSPRPKVAPRLRRVLAMLPFLAANPDTSTEELAARFDVSLSELERDLELLPFCGLPPYTPDRLIDVRLVDGHVSVHFAEYFERPLRLSPAEGLALLAAGRALLAVPGADHNGPLATALAKLEAVLEVGDGVQVEVGEPEFLEELRTAATDRRRLEIDYHSFGRDELTTRRIDPTGVFHALGSWYIAAHCHRAGAERLFRVDRVRAIRETGETFEPIDEEADVHAVFEPAPDDLRVTLALDASAGWVTETYPVESVEEHPDGASVAILAVSEPTWLARLLLQLGGSARVLDPPEAAGFAAAAAGRILERYRI